uniref:NADH dehydrogenase subunit 4L n=1 Tax=Solen strictus TaxID=194331 RepID=H9M5V6_9BIVA|nr:NADH dehydrogenase subunit 4L [Solen strictus]AER38723.1 NADH dehydrogenase subunit 4L [Solen strictus]
MISLCLLMFFMSLVVVVKQSFHLFMVVLGLDLMALSLSVMCFDVFSFSIMSSMGLAVMFLCLGVCEACLGLSLLVKVVRVVGVSKSAVFFSCYS